MTWRSSQDDENVLPLPRVFSAWERVGVRAVSLPRAIFERVTMCSVLIRIACG